MDEGTSGRYTYSQEVAMIVTFRVDPTSEASFVAALKAVPDALAEAVLPVCEDHVRLGIRKVFELEGPGWRSLARRTLYDKRRLGLPLDILVRSGDLRASLTERSNRYHRCDRVRHRGGMWRSTISSRHPLFLIHTEGRWESGIRGSAWIPPRPMAHMTTDDVRAMEAQARKAADDKLRELSYGN